MTRRPQAATENSHWSWEPCPVQVALGSPTEAEKGLLSLAGSFCRTTQAPAYRTSILGKNSRGKKICENYREGFLNMYLTV